MLNQNKDMHILENFEHIYTRKIETGKNNITSRLRVSQIKALFAFKDAHCFSLGELANNVGSNLPNMSCMIDSLIKDGIAELDTDDKDRKKVKVRLTPRGEKIRAQFLSHRRKVAKIIFNNLNQEDKAALLNSLDTACKILEKIS